MDKKEFNKIIKNLSNSVAGMTKEEKEYLFSCLGIEEEDMKMQGIESFIELASIDEKMVEKYGSYIDEYYKLPMCNRKKICNNVYKNFIRDGHMAIDSVCTLIVYEAERLEDHKEKDYVIGAIKKNIKRRPERPEINFNGVIDE